MWIDIDQNTEEWFNLRLGKITSSNFAKIMANNGKPFGNPAIEYAQKLALEYVTLKRDESSSFTNAYMQRGNELEPIAVQLYEQETLQEVTKGGFNVEDSEHIIKLGDSPDGNIGKDGCLEVKCVIPNTHWKRLKDGGYDTAYKWQIFGHIWLGNKQWCDFVSYCPEMPESKQLYIFRVFKEEETFAIMAERLNEFKEVVLEHIKLLQ